MPVPRNALVSLGLVQEGPVHVYGLNAVIEEMGIEDWTRLSRASICNTLVRLEWEGCVEVSVEHVGSRPQTKVHAIAQNGKQCLWAELTRALLESPAAGCGGALGHGLGVSASA